MAAQEGWPNTWLVEPVPPCDSENGHGQNTHRFFYEGTKLRKSSDLRSQIQCDGVSGGVKGRDERQSAAPLTPPLTPTLSYALTTVNVVIHRMTAR